jgi:hypothetical protein
MSLSKGQWENDNWQEKFQVLKTKSCVPNATLFTTDPARLNPGLRSLKPTTKSQNYSTAYRRRRTRRRRCTSQHLRWSAKRHQALTTVVMKAHIQRSFCVVTPYQLVNIYPRFDRVCRSIVRIIIQAEWMLYRTATLPPLKRFFF